MRHAKYEKTQPRNPHRLTVKQHFIPRLSIDRFANDMGFVELQLAKQKEICRASSDHWAFYVRRAWDERAEKGYMKQIEDDFQGIADKILEDETKPIDTDACRIITRFYALWHHRARLRPSSEIDIQMNGIAGEDLSLDDQERYEKLGVGFARKGGKVPTRQLVGVQLQVHTYALARQMEDYSWGVAKTEKGEFVFPDTPHHNFIPLTPKVLLAANNPSGNILKANLKQINIAMLSLTQEFFFARNIATALAGISKAEVTKACTSSLKKLDQANTDGTNGL